MEEEREKQHSTVERVVPAFVLRLRAGEHATAWSLFISEYSSALLRVIRRFARDEESCSDCYVFVCERLQAQCCRRLARFEPDGSARFTTWLHSVTHNLCLDWLRTQRPRLQIVSLDDPVVAATLTEASEAILSDPARQAEVQIDRERLAAALDRLAPEDRLLIRLRYEKELTLAELARLVGMANPQAVDRRLKALIGNLQEEFARSVAENGARDACQL